MKIREFISAKAVSADLKAKDKEGVITELVDLIIDTGSIEKKSKKKVLEVLMAREALGSTAIGQGIAIPHAKHKSTKKLVGCLGVSKEGIDFDSLDGELAHIFFLLMAPIDSAGPHLKALAKISRLLKDKFVRERLKGAKDEEEIKKIIDQEDDRLMSL
ncbi:MAG: PTS sugar transporter subunit IIA [Candidatus Omnitrophica bacterium]|nr:PTS sugar transporter subunit IIA [Candidatus Omnitrophota bacterium]MBU1997424.1 PTS sugar transporter subunit IIA [Candidatus Omnitrophota bacterium]MBU4333758.1 PTS sugar transporter subunit IIA [Candidatus Omnitrophota bacterium]